jgi:hypothetical protein
MMAAVGEDGINDVVGRSTCSTPCRTPFKQAGVVVDLRNQIESLQREAMRGASLLSGDRYTAPATSCAPASASCAPCWTKTRRVMRR